MDIRSDQIILVVVAVALVLLVRVVPRLLSKGKLVDPTELKRRLDAGKEAVVVDVRTPGEFAGRLGHIPGAVNLPLGDLKGRLKALGPEIADLTDQDVFVVCRTDNRSLSAAGTLHKAGFRKIFVIKGGMTRWNRAGYPVEGAS
jgi:rhodanese-related sulfurtransferase